MIDMRIVFGRIPQDRGARAVNRITTLCGDEREWNGEPQPVGEILQELLTQYEARFPGIDIVVVETAVTAA
jgi:hypothetical protein